MKKLNLPLALGLFAISISTIYGCKLKTEKLENKTLVTNVIQPKYKEPVKHYVKIALLLDTSNSMDGLINQAKAQLWDIVNEFTYARCGNEVRPALQIALYEYGNDDISSSCLLYTSPSPRDRTRSRMPSSA